MAGNEGPIYSPTATIRSTATYVCINNCCRIEGQITDLRKVCGPLLLEMVGHPVLILSIRLYASRQDSTTLCKRCRARALVPFAPRDFETAYHCWLHKTLQTKTQNTHHGSRSFGEILLHTKHETCSRFETRVPTGYAPDSGSAGAIAAFWCASATGGIKLGAARQRFIRRPQVRMRRRGLTTTSIAASLV